jgi:hypothetical protein
MMIVTTATLIGIFDPFRNVTNGMQNADVIELSMKKKKLSWGVQLIQIFLMFV